MVAHRHYKNTKQLCLSFPTNEKFKKHLRRDPDIKHLYKVKHLIYNVLWSILFLKQK